MIVGNIFKSEYVFNFYGNKHMDSHIYGVDP